jgi:hypothetical protein
MPTYSRVSNGLTKGENHELRIKEQPDQSGGTNPDATGYGTNTSIRAEMNELTKEEKSRRYGEQQRRQREKAFYIGRTSSRSRPHDVLFTVNTIRDNSVKFCSRDIQECREFMRHLIEKYDPRSGTVIDNIAEFGQIPGSVRI